MFAQPLCEPIFLCISVLRVALGPRVKLASCKSALNPNSGLLYWPFLGGGPGVSLTLCCFVYFLRGDLFYVLTCVILFLCFSVLLALRLPRFGKRELILVFFVRFSDLCLFGFVGFLFPLVSWKGYGLWLWHSLDFSLAFFFTSVVCSDLLFSSQSHHSVCSDLLLSSQLFLITVFAQTCY